MKRFVTLYGLLVLMPLLSVLLPDADAAIPGEDDPEAYTYRHRQRDILAYHRRHLVDDYLKVGMDNTDWHDKAIQYLECWTVHGTNVLLKQDELTLQRYQGPLVRFSRDLIEISYRC